MFKGILIRLRLVTPLIVALVMVLGAISPAVQRKPMDQRPNPTRRPRRTPAGGGRSTGWSNPYFSVETFTLSDGSRLERITINGPPTPPPGYELQRPPVKLPAPNGHGHQSLEVPTYSWIFGCSAVSASMIAAYCDRNGLPNIYTGPTNGGVMPMNNGVWPPGRTASANPIPVIRSRLHATARTAEPRAVQSTTIGSPTAALPKIPISPGAGRT